MPTARFRIGYPYDNPDQEKIKDSVVVLKKSEYRFFRCVYCKEEKYTLPEKDAGPKILQDYTENGLVGELIESDDNRQSIAREGKIHGEGKSMQLALVLAACAVYGNSSTDAPLLLFSAAVGLPTAAEPFIDAVVKTYAIEKEIESCLIHKYKAAQMAKAYALVLPDRDAKILAKALNEECQTLDKIHHENEEQYAKPMIVGISATSLPDLAEQIGISRHYFFDSRHIDNYPKPEAVNQIMEENKPISQNEIKSARSLKVEFVPNKSFDSLPDEKAANQVMEENKPADQNEIKIAQSMKVKPIPKKRSKLYFISIFLLIFIFLVFSLYQFFLKPTLLLSYKEEIAKMDSRLELLYNLMGLERTLISFASNLEDQIQALWHDIVRFQKILGTESLRKDWQSKAVPTEDEISQGKYKAMLPKDTGQAISMLEQRLCELYHVMGL